MAKPDSTSINQDEFTFHPDHITPQTFDTLLSLYPKTVEQAYSHKIRQKRSKSKSTKRKTDTDTNTNTNTNTNLDHITEETNKYIELDKWRYETLPDILAKRAEEKGPYLLKEELVNLMDWKLKHGVSRPMLMGMIKSNTDSTIEKSTATAFATLPVTEEFPKSSLDALTTPLRGVGPATASLVLSVASIPRGDGQEVPFYSDDVYLWVCCMDYPGMKKGGNGELIAKYDLKEYRELWGATRVLRDRLNLAKGGGISLVDVERVAYVLRNIGVSGYDWFPVEDEVVEKSEVGERRSKRVKR
ncbi:uncharacterized protein N7515_000071 [Penicillium bovifimosum]|uniref:Uncharacterized protein n=1 Tax=Penicillium bovifimosum TaxID=126998 RepID=A0A9W9HEP2_9EURO|nr:uncharacterized protein N7515_000071 [Penicillium bovifimosum]KAJ5145507.1 hypothetical protein N7515_000071 [Penicillium bovifimosum]